MAYRDEVTVISLPMAKETSRKLEEIRAILGKKSKASLANEILELVITDFYEQLKDGAEDATYTISMQKGDSPNKRLYWHNSKKEN